MRIAPCGRAMYATLLMLDSVIRNAEGVPARSPGASLTAVAVGVGHFVEPPTPDRFRSLYQWRRIFRHLPLPRSEERDAVPDVRRPEEATCVSRPLEHRCPAADSENGVVENFIAGRGCRGGGGP